MDPGPLTAALPAVTAALAGGIGGALVPRVVGRLPEPEPEADEDQLVPADDEEDFARPVDDPKELYADIAALPGLRWKCALVSALAAALMGVSLGWSPALLFCCYLAPVGVALGLVDWRTRYLPSAIIVPSYAVVGVLVVVASLLAGDWVALRNAAIGWVGAFGFYFVLWFVLPRALAYGDVRLSGVLGMALGWIGISQLVFGLYLGFLLGGVFGLLLSALKVFHHKHTPFGPYMVLGAFVAVALPGVVSGVSALL